MKEKLCKENLRMSASNAFVISAIFEVLGCFKCLRCRGFENVGARECAAAFKEIKCKDDLINLLGIRCFSLIAGICNENLKHFQWF